MDLWHLIGGPLDLTHKDLDRATAAEALAPTRQIY